MTDEDEYLDHFKRDAVPKIASSAYVMNIVPDADEIDAKVCLEIGAAILMNKPLVLVVTPGRPLPPGSNLRRVATEVIEADLNTDAGKQHLTARLAAFHKSLDH